jgi:hypothetical protein
LRPRLLDADSLVKANVGVIEIPNLDSGQGEASLERAPVVISSDNVSLATPSGKVADSFPAKSLLLRRFLKPVSLSPPEEGVVLALGSAESSSTGEVSAVWVSEKGKVAIRQPSSEKGMIRRGFLLWRSHVSSPKGFVLQTSSGEVLEGRGFCALEER